MNVKQLKKILSTFDDNDLVVMSRDEEGNGYSELAHVSVAVYSPREQYIYVRNLTENLRQQGFTEEDLCSDKDGKNAIVLYPE